MHTPAQPQAPSGHAAPAPPEPDRAASDRALVARLLSEDESVRIDAWTKVLGEMVLPSVLHSRKWTEILERLGESPEAVASEVYLSLTADDNRNIRAFRFERSFSSHVYEWTWAAMQTLRRAREKEKEFSADLSETGVLPALTGRGCMSPDRAVSAREALALANRHLAALWDANPVHAIVLLLRNCDGLRAKEVSAITGLSPSNVDQIHKRALARLKAIAGKEGGPET
ncbi:MAG: sigma-70 family RNA polymerase sigma factor [Kiritimatiellae bacterium]|nr:sigma-70 family RNA polymerase sigma factor [Kiritimatiellia bacterium]